MKKNILFAICAGLCVLFLGCCRQQPQTGVIINGASIPYVQQGTETYVYLKDLLEYGFCLDVMEGRTVYQKTGREYYFVLWTEGLHEIENPDLVQILTPRLSMTNRIYINGMDISAYTLAEELLIDITELSALVSDDTYPCTEAPDVPALYFDAQGAETPLQERVALLTPRIGSTVDGDPEPPGKFQFENCSPYFVQAEKPKKEGDATLLHIMQRGEWVKTEKGTFRLLEIFAGNLGGVRLTIMLDDYTNFCSVLQQLELAYTIENGILKIEGDGNRTICQTDQPEAVQSLPYYHERILKTELDIGEFPALECFYTGDTFYLRRKDAETKEILKENGYFYQNYAWYPKSNNP